MTRDELRDRQQWGRGAMVATADAAASLAAMDVLGEGGNAFDAAITVSAVLTVVQPMACGPGGDVAAVLHMADTGKTITLTSLGRAPSGATPEAFTGRGHTTVPPTGILSVSTPALMDSWYTLHRRLGSLPLERLLEPAVRFAADGTVVTDQFARWTGANLDVLVQEEFSRTYGPYGNADSVGSLIRQPGLADLYTLVSELAYAPDKLRRIIGESVAKVSSEFGGLLTAADCVVDHARLHPAKALTVAGHTVATTPAPTQGPLLLQNLALYQRLTDGSGADTAAGIHLLAEIANQTYGRRLEYLGDPDFVNWEDPLDPALLDILATGVNIQRRSDSLSAGHYTQADTSHFALVDADGNGVSWVQSLGLGFGSGVGVSELGLLLGNRLGRSATIDPTHPNCCAPGKRPVNTIFPWSAYDGSNLWLGGTPGGDGQTQWNAQALLALLVDDTGPLRALSRPRWTYYPGVDKVEAAMGPQLRVDASMGGEVIEQLRGLGHDVVPKASVGGVVRLVGRRRGHTYGLDEGRHEGLTLGR